VVDQVAEMVDYDFLRRAVLSRRLRKSIAHHVRGNHEEISRKRFDIAYPVIRTSAIPVQVEKWVVALIPRQDAAGPDSVDI
jgi:hypothetical protein